MEKLKRSKKFLLGLCALIVVVAAVSVGVTWSAINMFGAYRNTNVFTIGNVDIELVDEYTRQDNIPPNTQVPKKVYVANTGTVPCYVRVFLKKYWEYGDKPDPGADKIVPEVSPPRTGNPGKYADSGLWVLGTNPYAGLDDSSTDPMKTYKDYDCWYYQRDIDPGAITQPSLFTNFHLESADAGKPYTGMEGKIVVMAQAVQSEYIVGEMETNTNGKIINWPTEIGEGDAKVKLEFKLKGA